MKPIPNYSNYYINSTGLIFNEKTGTVLKHQVNSNGYLTVNLYNTKGRKTFKVHILVAVVFVPNPDNKPDVDHIDGDKLNPHKDNLRWCTHEENCAWARQKGLHLISREKKTVTLDGIVYPSIYEAAKFLSDTYGKKMDTVRRELRRRKTGTIYGHKIG